MRGSVNGFENATFEESIVALYPQLVRLAFRLCRNAADARDLAQDAIERGLRCRESFRTGDAPDRWMCTILRRMFLDGCRSRRRRAHIPIAEVGDALRSPEADVLPAWETFTADDVQRALLFLDAESRQVFRLFAFDRLPQEEIAQRLAISRRTVATRVFRTRAKLRKLLESGAYRRQLALVPTPDAPADLPEPPAAPGRLPQHPPRTRVAARRRPRQAPAASSA